MSLSNTIAAVTASPSMRRTYARGVTALAIALALSACGSDEPTQATWVGHTTDGETVVIAEGDSTAFTGGVPEPVSIIDGLDDCTAIRTEMDFWAASTDDADVDFALRSKAYTLHAAQRLAELDCI